MTLASQFKFKIQDFCKRISFMRAWLLNLKQILASNNFIRKLFFQKLHAKEAIY